MRTLPARVAVLAALLLVTAACGEEKLLPGPPPDEELPDHWKEGLADGVNLGLAQDYPEDVGIAAHPNVLAAEDFESGQVLIPTSIQFNLHRTTEDFPQTMIRWTDNIVLATRYIGPPRLP